MLEPTAKQLETMANWGKDHWSTLAYLETRWVDHTGTINPSHMRCNPARHPEHAHEGSRGGLYPTRLKGGSTIEGHDDWDCVGDFATVGLLVLVGTPTEPRIQFTGLGNKVSAALRVHKGHGGSFGNFEYRP